jgi:DNA-binding transcriptional LysR family regulator
VAINEHHPLAKQDAIELIDIADEPMLTLALDKSSFPRYLIQCCVNAGFQPTIFQEASEPQTLLAMVGAGLGVTLIPETTSRIGWPGVVFLPIRTNPPSANLYITYTTTDDAPVVRAFLNILNPPDASVSAARLAHIDRVRQRGAHGDAQAFDHVFQLHAGRAGCWPPAAASRECE